MSAAVSSFTGADDSFAAGGSSAGSGSSGMPLSPGIAPLGASLSAASASAGAPAGAPPSAPAALPAEQEEDLWSAILASASRGGSGSNTAAGAGSNSTGGGRGLPPTRNIVLLGEPGAGKRALLNALAGGKDVLAGGSSSGSGSGAQANGSAAGDSTQSAQAHAQGAPSAQAQAQQDGVAPPPPAPAAPPPAAQRALLGLAYGYFDVSEDLARSAPSTSASTSATAGPSRLADSAAAAGSEEVVARVGAYVLHSSHPAYTRGLLRQAFPPPPGGEPSLATGGGSRGAGIMAAASAPGSAGGAAALARPSLAALGSSLVVLMLDWAAPQAFLDQLRRWLAVLRDVVDDAADGAISAREDASAAAGGAAAGQAQTQKAQWSARWAAFDEMRENLENTLRAYHEPAAPAGLSASGGDGTSSSTSGSGSAPAAALASSASVLGDAAAALQLPLPEGCLDGGSNFGVGLVVVCNKADAMGALELERSFKEEQFDYVQQVLRVVCLKYGAALFYVSRNRPDTIACLRRYLLHRLFDAPGASGVPSSAARFRPTQRASTVDRDTVFVPAGWDSYGKIKALRGSEDSFDPKAVRTSWETDFAVELERRRRLRQREQAAQAQAGGASGGAAAQASGRDSDAALTDDALRRELFSGPDGAPARSAVQLFEDVVGDWHARAPPAAPGLRVAEPDMQAFLAQHYAALQKEPQEAKPGSAASAAAAPAAHGDARAAREACTEEVARGVMGPMASDALDLLPKMQIDGEDAAGDAAPVRSSKSRSDKRDRPRVDTDSLALPTSRSGSRPTSPSLGGTGGGGGGSSSSSGGVPKQSEVLQSFFQSLLKDKPPAGAKSSSAARSSAQKKPSNTPSSAGESRSETPTS